MNEPPPVPPQAEQRFEPVNRHAVVFFEHSRSFADAIQAGLPARLVKVRPSVIKTYKGDIEILESWLEQRPHPDAKARAQLAKIQKREFLEDHCILNFRIRNRTVEEATYGGIWFTDESEWFGFSWGGGEIRSLRIWGQVPEKIELTVTRIHDIDIEKKPIRPQSGLGMVQTLEIEDIPPENKK